MRAALSIINLRYFETLLKAIELGHRIISSLFPKLFFPYYPKTQMMMFSDL